MSAAFLYEQVIDGTKVELTKNKRISNELNTIMESKIQGWKYVGYQRVGHYGKSKAYERTSVPADYTWESEQSEQELEQQLEQKNIEIQGYLALCSNCSNSLY